MAEYRASDDMIDAIMGNCNDIDRLHYGEVRFTIRDGRLVSVQVIKDMRVGKELPAREAQVVSKKH